MHSPQLEASILDGEETTSNGTNGIAPPTDAPPPFNSPHADVILQSSDSVNFRVRKAILAEASPFFETMFSLPTGSTENHACTSPDLPVVPMQEDSTTVDGLLRFCYPAGRRLREMGLDDISVLLPAARKYAMDQMVDYLTLTLEVFIGTSPLRVYCLAIHHQLGEHLTRAAARGFLDQPIQTAYIHTPELDHISGSAYARLLDYHHRCFVRYNTGLDSTWDERCWRKCHSVTVDVANKGCTYKSLENCRRISAWFVDFAQTFRNLAKDRPSGTGKGVPSQTAITTALVDAGKCAYCGERAWADLQSFMSVSRGKINDAISEASESLEFIA
ncbi:uncharacterized protein B0H18DRAFT_1053203 [Fomitopsis serialis]|uniref:uncharacterized protein n=1 Tax=Fomitopsis serialis TaxID=139415 RepID=UPI002007C1DC|nr:uncharacterized protein B0H18DRAFT_1053203 [Neoantrodia serialis]KAH9912574.1 hypothetical protein B0H18DRAFT_1053203 [Neoantrodia serialis]